MPRRIAIAQHLSIEQLQQAYHQASNAILRSPISDYMVVSPG